MENITQLLASLTMEHWQFLIQKQGDRSWHTLESPNIELLEGRYRVLARSSLPNTDVEIRVTHFSTQEVPPKRRIQKRSRRTNSEGLMAVIPFTHLQAGIWELRCSGDLMSEILGQFWQYGVNLKVLSRESGVESNLPYQPDLIATFIESNAAITNLSTEKAEEAAMDQPVSPVWLKGETAEQILQNLIELALPTSELLLEDKKLESSPAIQPPLPLVLSLARETYIAHWGQKLTINGRVELQEQTNLESRTLYPESLYAVELKIELRSPLGSEILTEVRQPLADDLLPLSISPVINIPGDCESKLILADISLYGAITPIGEVMLLANKSFTITADVTELLAITTAVKPQLNNSSALSIASAAQRELEASVSIDLELFNLAKIPPDPQPIHPSPSQPLPEQINPRSLQKTTDSYWLQLPKLPENPIEAILDDSVEAAADLVAEPNLEEESVEKDDIIAPMAPINLDLLVINHRREPKFGSTFPYLKRRKVLPSDIEEVQSTLEPQSAVESPQIEDENIPKLLVGADQSQDESEAELEALPSLELIDDSEAELEALPSSELSTTGSLYTSPLIRKWMESQGYSMPESIDEPYPEEDIAVTEQQIIPDEQVTLSVSPQIPSVDVDLYLNLDAQTENNGDSDEVIFDEINTEENTVTEEILEEVAASTPPVPQLLLTSPVKTPPAWLSQEIVLDDTYIDTELDITSSLPWEPNEQPISNLSGSLPKTIGIVEPLPIPQLHVPDGELIAGNSIRVRVELFEVSPQVAVKLWVEDCQTRGLLDGPHLLTDLLPNSWGGLEVTTQLNIPFGCLEIRLEAIALDMTTQKESHKVTIVRTVIPPDLPNLQLDELLGM